MAGLGIASVLVQPAVATDRGREPLATASALVLVTGLSAGYLAQGGFYPVGRLPLLVALPAALALALAAHRLQRADLWSAPVLLAVAFAAWAVVRGAAGFEPSSGLGPCLLLLGFAAVLVIVRGAGRSPRAVVLAGVLGIGLAVSLAGWVGVVWHVHPWSLPQDGMWRAASTLTYANATAAALVPLSLLSLGLLCARPADRALSACAAVLLIGSVATLSRAGILSLVVGITTLGLLVGARPLLRGIVAPLLGASVAGAGLLPSMPLDSPAGRPWAVLTLVVGVLLAAALAPVPWPPLPTAVLLPAAAVGTLLFWSPASTALEVSSLRLWSGNGPRLDATDQALRLAAADPLFGVGPGQHETWLRWSASDGPSMTMRFVHNEYLQVLVGLGAVGLGLLLALLVAAVVLLRRSRRGAEPAGLWAGASAGLAAMAFHGGFDFVWHVPVIPLTAAVLLALAAGPFTERLKGGMSS